MYELLRKVPLFAGLLERKRAEDELKDNLPLLRATLESTTDGILVIDRAGKIVSFNGRFVEMWHIPESIVETRDDDQVLAFVLDQLKDPEGFLSKVRELYDQPDAESYDVLEFKDGRVFDRYSQPQWEEKAIVGRVWSFRDVTERKRAEEALADMASFAEMNPAPVLRLDRQGTILLVNPAARDLLGEPDLLGKSWYALCLELEPNALERLLRDNDTLQCETEVGERRLLFTHRASLDGGQVYVYGADITERKRAEEALRESETMLRQSEKMAVLGTLTAGVAHELNNPAAAVKSAAGQLEVAIAQFGRAQSRLSGLSMAATQQKALQRLIHQAREQATSPLELNALARSDRELKLETWLEEQGLSNARELAPTLANLNYDTAGLTTLADEFAPDQLSAVIGGLVATYVVHSVLTEIGQSAGRISEIVKALKSYSYLDQAPVQAVDVHEGLDNTLLVLAHKLKSGISVRKEYAPQLPKIQANGGELNQVWTNIIDNAADALEGQGEITIRTRQDGQQVVIEIEDDGPGIPAEIQSRIFEPFFTTKPPGLGTGLGLDISYNIVVHKHRGDIKVLSQPGRTCFQVWLPVNSEAEVTLGKREE